MTSIVERFWIFFILRLGFGLFFVVASINQFDFGGPGDFGPDAFARKVTKPYETNWLGAILPMIDIGEKGQEAVPAVAEEKDEAGKVTKKAVPAQAAVKAKPDLVSPTYFAMFALPFIFALLAVPILTGIFLKPALRLAAILLVCLGVGSYIGTPSLDTMAHDFFFAFLICVALYVLSREKEAEMRV